MTSGEIWIPINFGRRDNTRCEIGSAWQVLWNGGKRRFWRTLRLTFSIPASVYRYFRRRTQETPTRKLRSVFSTLSSVDGSWGGSVQPAFVFQAKAHDAVNPLPVA